MIDPLTLPKAELHLHIEGTLEPELMFELARRNGVRLPYADAEAVRRAYRFGNLQSFLDVYYRACSVLVHERDFYELTTAYLARARAQGVRHVEIFFDPQTHTARGVQFETVVDGIGRALTEARQLGITSHLIMCFLRDQPVDDAMATLEQAVAHRDMIFGVGLDSAEVGNPPQKFRSVFERATSAGFRAVAHAGEEGPPEYIWQALDVLGAERIDHGVRCLEDRRLVQRLEADRTPLTVCPFSNVKLRVVDTLGEHPLARMLEHGLCATVNSDDPAYFGGYVGENLAGVADALKLEDGALVQLARNSFEAAFLDEATRARYLAELDATHSVAKTVSVGDLGGLFEHSPWVVEDAWRRRPFRTVAELESALEEAMREAPRERQLELIRSHPELAGREAQERALTRESTHEQVSAGLDQLTADELEALRRLNRSYRERFGFPLIVCVREHTKDSIIAWGNARLEHSREQEIDVALGEITKIARLRLADLLEAAS